MKRVAGVSQAALSHAPLVYRGVEFVKLPILQLIVCATERVGRAAWLVSLQVNEVRFLLTVGVEAFAQDFRLVHWVSLVRDMGDRLPLG